MSRTTPARRPAAPASGRTRSARKIDDAVRDIVPSDEPSVVLSRLARASNPSFSDACAVELSEGTSPPFQVCFPMPGDGDCPAGPWSVPGCAGTPPGAMKTITTTFRAGSGHGYPSFAGIVTHSWSDREPTGDDAIIARLLVDYALALVQHERLAQAAARAESRAAQLAIDMITSRIEGEATGILMAQRQLSRAEAVSLLRRASQAHQRELHEIAAGVVRAGDLDCLRRRTADAGRAAAEKLNGI
jgi:hypothetical protein